MFHLRPPTDAIKAQRAAGNVQDTWLRDALRRRPEARRVQRRRRSADVMMRHWESERLEPVGARDHARGPKDAPVTLVKYGDYECPYCGQAHPMLKELQERAGKRVRFVFRHFPLAPGHPRARRAAQAAEAAAAQDRFWEMHDLLYENQSELGDEDLMR